MDQENEKDEHLVATDEQITEEGESSLRGVNIFGEPITDETLKKMPKYQGKIINQRDRAREAMKLIHAKGKNMEVLQHMLDYKKRFGYGTSTLCMVYNATGNTLQFVGKIDWSGRIWGGESPKTIENGQWVGFLHVNPDQDKVRDSSGGRVFRTSNMDGDVRDFLVAWNTPWHLVQNSAYTEVRGKDHFPQYWSHLYDLLTRAKKITKDDTDQNFTSTVSIGGITSPEFIAILEHKDSF